MSLVTAAGFHKVSLVAEVPKGSAGATARPRAGRRQALRRRRSGLPAMSVIDGRSRGRCRLEPAPTPAPATPGDDAASGLAFVGGAACRHPRAGSARAAERCSAQPPPQETPIAVQLVTIAPETRATQPNPFRPNPEAKPEPPIAAPAPKPEPKPEPPRRPRRRPRPRLPPPPPPPPEAKPDRQLRRPSESRAEAAAAPAAARSRSRRRRRPPPPPPGAEAETRAAAAGGTPRPKPKQDPAAFEPKPEAEDDPAAITSCSRESRRRRKSRPDAFDSLLKNLTKEQTAQSRRAAAGPRPKASLGAALLAAKGAARQPADGERERLLVRRAALALLERAGRRARRQGADRQVRASVDPDGTVRQATIVDQGRISDPLVRAAAESARRAFFNPQCTPLRCRRTNTRSGRTSSSVFDPKDLL